MSDKKLKEGEQSPEQYAKEIKEHINANHFEHLKQHSPKSGKAVRK